MAFVSSSSLSTRPPQLRLFTSDSAVPDAASTLRQCFDEFILPELQEAERTTATIREYRAMLTHWESYTPNPQAGEIDRPMVKAFRKKLITEPYLRGKKRHRRSPATVNKIMRTLIACITPLWPADRHNPGGKGIIEFFGFPEALNEQKELPFVFSKAEMSALYLACDACKCTTGHRKSHLYDPRLWRAAIVLALNVGPRTWDLFALKKAEFRPQDFKYGSVRFCATKTQKMQRVPLNKVARAHLDYILSLDLHPDLVFPGFRKNKSFYAAWKRICAKANVNAPFESFRKTCSTKHDDVVRGVGEWICGHGIKGVNAENYQNPTVRVFKAIYGLKPPCEFVRGAKALQALQA